MLQNRSRLSLPSCCFSPFLLDPDSSRWMRPVSSPWGSSVRESLHRLFKTGQRHREHAIGAKQFIGDLDRRRVVPAILCFRIEPDQTRELLLDTLEPDRASFLVPMLDAAAGVHDQIGSAHVRTPVTNAH